MVENKSSFQKSLCMKFRDFKYVHQVNTQRLLHTDMYARHCTRGWVWLWGWVCTRTYMLPLRLGESRVWDGGQRTVSRVKCVASKPVPLRTSVCFPILSFLGPWKPCVPEDVATRWRRTPWCCCAKPLRFGDCCNSCWFWLGTWHRTTRHGLALMETTLWRGRCSNCLQLSSEVRS